MSGPRTPTSHASRAFGPGSRTPGVAVALLAAGVVALLAGCGTSATSSGSRTAGTATTQTAPVPKVSQRVKAEERALHHDVSAALHHDNDAHTRYGGLPADIRHRQAPPPNQVLSASAARPADAIQGVSVRLHLAHGTALATAVGPDVPTRIQGTSDLHTPAVWDLTFADVHGTIPIAARMFSITDEQGQLLSPHVKVLGGASLPHVVPAGRPFTLRLSTRVSVGDGKLRYAPTGGRWLSEWDFNVETD
jgi:hypothetical protein